VFDSQGRRIAEYNEGTGALIREYVWMGWEPVAVIEGGVTSFVRTDHIGRPVFATNTAGVKVWTATYDPFGGVRTTVGTPINARFPGQWFQSESGLHQNWMRDYDPTTGRYLQADPLGLMDGASVYGYAMQSPMTYTDPRGLFTLGQADSSLLSRGVPFDSEYGYAAETTFNEWLRLERENREWLKEVVNCPCGVEPYEGYSIGPNWNPLTAPTIVEWYFHGAGISWGTRSKPTNGGHGNQCLYDSQGRLITDIPIAGSVDYFSPDISSLGHNLHDVQPFSYVSRLGRVTDYFDVRPIK
jgi:RHS repeat-associated protein